MALEDCDYEPTSLWCADLLLRANQLVGAPGADRSAEQLRQIAGFNGLLCSMAAGSPTHPDHIRAAVFTMSMLRREVASTLKGAQAASSPTRHPLSYAAFDWLSTAAYESNAFASASDIKAVVDHGMLRLRTVLSDAATHYMDVTTSDRTRELMRLMSGKPTARLVRGALTMQVAVGLFDSARLGVGLRLTNYAFGSIVAPLGDELNRAEQARTDAYMAMRLYKALEIVLALMMMGVAKMAEEQGDRNAWARSSGGKVVLAFRSEVGATLHAYDEAKRAPSIAAGKTYTAQTAGYVSSLQEQAATFAMRLQEPDSELYEAFTSGLSSAGLFYFSAGAPASLSGRRYTFWDATNALGDQVHAGTPVRNTVSMACSMLLFGAVAEESPYLLHHSRAMRTAMAEASKSWPSVESFYGRDYKDTERKITSKAQREAGRDPFGREVGEMLGYRLEWMGYLANGPPQRSDHSNADIAARQAAAVTTMAQVEVHNQLGPVRAMPMPSGNAIHQVHAIALAMEPGLLGYAHRAGCTEQSHLFEVGDERYKNAVAQLGASDHLQRKQLFVERVVERVAPLYKAWSGGALATECFHEFFAEVWKRFNDNMRREGSPWADKLTRWLEHYTNDTAPPRANGEAKLIHPWRLMHLQKSVAKALLIERYGELALCQLPDLESRVSMRYQRSLISGLIDVYDYAPWSSHIIRRFCSMDEHRSAKRRREEQLVTSHGLEPPNPMPVDPPTRRARVRSDSPSLTYGRLGGQIVGKDGN